MKHLEDMTEPELGELMQAFGEQINAVAAVMNCEPPHFALLVFNDPAVAQYISNCKREDIIVAMGECADILRRNQDVPRKENENANDF